MSTKKKKNNKKSKKNNQKKKILIISIVVFLCILLLVGGFFLFRNIKKNAPIKQDWGQTYYAYLKDKKEVQNEEPLLPKEAENPKLNFYEVKDVEKPVMVVNYNIKEEHYTNVYYIVNNQVNTIIYNEPTNIVFLYNIENNEYNYYFHMEEDNKEHYVSLTNQIQNSLESETEDNKLEQEPDYSYTKDEVETIKDSEGNEVTVSKFEETFVIPEVEEKEGINFTLDLEEKELKEMVESSIDNYETKEEIVTEDVKNNVNTKVEDVNKRKEEIKKIKEEQEKAKQELENIFKSLKGIWVETGKDKSLSVNFAIENKKKKFVAGWIGSEAYLLGYMKDIKCSDNIYQFTVSSEKIKVDVSGLKNKRIKIGNITYTYYGKDYDEAYKKLGWF